MMSREKSTARAMRVASLFSLIVFACLASVRAQPPPVPNGTLIPRVCVETPYQTGAVTLAANAAVGDVTISVNGSVPPLVALIINPGTPTEERVAYVNVRIDGNNPYTLSMKNSFHYALRRVAFGGTDSSSHHLNYAHSAGETVRFEGYSGTAHFGYNNTSNASIFILQGPSAGNYFQPGDSTYTQQASTFQPGIHDNVFSVPFGGQLSDTLAWQIHNSRTAAANQGQGCGTITYQGRLSDANAAANGQYDLRFTTFDALTGGAAQSDAVTVENAQVTNGVFTVQLNFGSSFRTNQSARFLEIGVRPGAATGNDPFTLLAPRQPITAVPFAVSAQTAYDLRLPLAYQGDPNPPLSSECTDANRGQMKYHILLNRLYVCTLEGWKYTTLQ